MNKNFKIIDFCNLRTPVVNNDILQSNILENIVEYLNFKKPNGLYDNSFDYQSSDLKKNGKFKFRSNGIKAYIYFTVQGNKYHSYLIEQITQSNKINIICTRFRVNPAIYNESLFYGELIYRKDEKWGFYIQDIIMLNGKKDVNLDSFNLKQNYVQDDVIEICSLNTFKYYSLEELQKIDINHILNLDYQVIGLEIFNQQSQHILYFNNLDSNVEMVDESGNKNVSFVSVKKEIFQMTKDSKLPDIYYLYKKIGKNYDSKFEIAYIPTLELSKKLRQLFKNKEAVDIECEYSNKINKWMPLLV